MKFGYARVSTPKQSLEVQIEKLKEANCDKIFSDVVSGVKSKKKGFQELLKFLRKGDSLVVTAIDRLGRSTLELAYLYDKLHKEGVNLVLLEHNVDTNTPHGKLMFDFMAMIAENTRRVNAEHTRLGIEAAIKRGAVIGQPYKICLKFRKKLLLDCREKKMSRRDLCKLYGIGLSTLYKYLREDAQGEKNGSNKKINTR